MKIEQIGMNIYLQCYFIHNCIQSSNTPYQLGYGLHPLMPIKYIVLVVSGNERDNTLMRVLTSRIIELKKLQEVRI